MRELSCYLLQEKLIDVFDELLPQVPGQNQMDQFTFLTKPVSHDALIIGALEAAFWEMVQFKRNVFYYHYVLILTFFIRLFE